MEIVKIGENSEVEMYPFDNYGCFVGIDEDGDVWIAAMYTDGTMDDESFGQMVAPEQDMVDSINTRFDLNLTTLDFPQR